MFALVPTHLIYDLLGAVSAVRFARHHLPDWMFYPACALVTIIVVCSIGAAVSAWTEKRAVAEQCSGRDR